MQLISNKFFRKANQLYQISSLYIRHGNQNIHTLEKEDSHFLLLTKILQLEVVHFKWILIKDLGKRFYCMYYLIFLNVVKMIILMTKQMRLTILYLNLSVSKSKEHYL